MVATGRGMSGDDERRSSLRAHRGSGSSSSSSTVVGRVLHLALGIGALRCDATTSVVRTRGWEGLSRALEEPVPDVPLSSGRATEVGFVAAAADWHQRARVSLEPVR